MTLSDRIGEHAQPGDDAQPERDWATSVEPVTRRPPAFFVCLLLFLLADAFSGQKFGLPLPVGPDRVIFALFIVLLAVDPRIRWRTWRVKSATGVAALALLWAVLSAYSHGTLETRLGAFALLDRLAVPYLLFALAPVALSTRRSRIVLLQFLCLLGIYLGITAVFEIIGPTSLVFPRYIADPTVGISYGRARGPFLASDADAATMAFCLFAALGLRMVLPSRRWRLVAAVSAVACLAGVLLALTRAEWIGTAVALVVTGLVVPDMRRKLPAAIVALAIAIAAVLVVSPTLRGRVTSRTSSSRSVYDRQNTDAGAIRAIEEHPLFGIGWSEYVLQSDRYVRQSPNYPLTTTDIEVHNVGLGRLTELGLLGGGLWILSVLAGPVAAVFRRRQSDPLDEAYHVVITGVVVVWLIAIQFSPFPYPLPNALLWLLAGAAVSPLSPRMRHAV